MELREAFDSREATTDHKLKILEDYKKMVEASQLAKELEQTLQQEGSHLKEPPGEEGFCSSFGESDHESMCAVACPCPSCIVSFTQTCHCGKAPPRKVHCGQTSELHFSCGAIYNRELNYGNYLCETPCHERTCPSCPLLPMNDTFCPFSDPPK